MGFFFLNFIFSFYSLLLASLLLDTEFNDKVGDRFSLKIADFGLARTNDSELMTGVLGTFVLEFFFFIPQKKNSIYLIINYFFFTLIKTCFINRSLKFLLKFKFQALDGT